MAGPIPTDVAAEEAPPVSFPYRAAHLPGIPLFGYLMGTAPQTAHFRIFSVATTRVLLFLQHELHVLELQLLEAERRCSNSSDRSNFDFQHIKRSRLDTASQQGDRVPSPGDSASSARWETTKYEIMLEMKDKLKEYHETILRFRKLALHDADDAQIKEIQVWLDSPEFCDQKLTGIESDIWGSLHQPNHYASDLIPLIVSGAKNRGSFVQWFSGPFLRWLHSIFLRHFKKTDDDGRVTYNDHWVAMFSSVVEFLVSIFLIYFGICILEKGGSRSMQVWKVILFTTLTSICIAVVGNQKLFVVVAALATLFVGLLENKCGGTP